LRIGGEFGPAAGRAEMKGFAAVIEPMFACRGIDGHSADVEYAIASGDKSDQREKISELMAVIGRSDR
jgi:hypothetical protein